MGLGLPNLFGDATRAVKSWWTSPQKPTSYGAVMPPGSWETKGPYGNATRDVGLLGSYTNAGRPAAPASAPWSLQSYQAAQRTTPGWATLAGMKQAVLPKTAENNGFPYKSAQQVTIDNDPVLQMLRAQLGQFDTQRTLAQQQASAAQQQAGALANWNRQQIEAQYNTDSRLLSSDQYRTVTLADQLADQLFGIQQQHYGATYGDMQRQLDMAARVRDEYLNNSYGQENISQRGHDLTVDELNRLYDLDRGEYDQTIKYLGQLGGFADQEYQQGTQYSEALRNFMTRQYGEGVHYSDELRNFLTRHYGEEKAYSGELRKYLTQQFGLAQDTARQEDSQAKRAAKSDAITRGAMSSTGYGQTRQDLMAQLALAIRGNGLGYSKGTGEINERDRGLLFERDKGYSDVNERNRGLALQRDKGYRDVDERNKELRRSYETKVADINRQQQGAYSEIQRDFARTDAGLGKADLDLQSALQDLGYGQQKAITGYDQFYGDIGYQWGETARKQQADDAAYGNQQQMFASLAQDYGIRQQDMQRVMQQGVNRIGLDYNATMQKITADYASGDAQRRAQAAALQSQILQYGK